VFGLPFESGHVLALMSETMPSGHVGILMPQRMYFIDQATTVDDEDLGHAVRVSPNPQIGQVPLPARGCSQSDRPRGQYSTTTSARLRLVRSPEARRVTICRPAVIAATCADGRPRS